MQQQAGYTGASPFQPGATSAALDGLADSSQPFLDGFAQELLQGQGSLPLSGDLFAGLPQPAFPASPRAQLPTSGFDFGQVCWHMCRSL